VAALRSLLGIPLALPVADHKKDHVAAPATFGDIEHVHLHKSQAFIAALTDCFGAPARAASGCSQPVCKRLTQVCRKAR
jgi:hypothetical protein